MRKGEREIRERGKERKENQESQKTINKQGFAVVSIVSRRREGEERNVINRRIN